MLKFSDDRVLIVAEVGSNHNGDLETAFALIDVAAACSADVVKFQSFLVDELLEANDPNYARLKALELPRDWYPRLKDRCDARGVTFLSTATNETTIDLMEELGVEGYKVASCNITYRPLLDRLIAIGKPLIVSTGMAELEEIEALAGHFDARGFREYALLHCVARYPCPPGEMRLNNIPALRGRLGCVVGLSDHSPSCHIPVAAVALGARIVEKHLSLNKQGIGMDHEVAVLPDLFREMCRGIRETESALVENFATDRETIFRMRRSLHFRRAMRPGETVKAEDVKCVRPEDGLPPSALDAVIGCAVTGDVSADQPVTWDVIAAKDARA